MGCVHSHRHLHDPLHCSLLGTLSPQPIPVFCPLTGTFSAPQPSSSPAPTVTPGQRALWPHGFELRPGAGDRQRVCTEVSLRELQTLLPQARGRPLPHLPIPARGSAVFSATGGTHQHSFLMPPLSVFPHPVYGQMLSALSSDAPRCSPGSPPLQLLPQPQPLLNRAAEEPAPRHLGQSAPGLCLAAGSCSESPRAASSLHPAPPLAWPLLLSCHFLQPHGPSTLLDLLGPRASGPWLSYSQAFLTAHVAPPTLCRVLRCLPRPLLTNLATKPQHLTTYPPVETLVTCIVGGDRREVESIQRDYMGIYPLTPQSPRKNLGQRYTGKNAKAGTGLITEMEFILEKTGTVHVASSASN